jgi:hypothetical protein
VQEERNCTYKIYKTNEDHKSMVYKQKGRVEEKISVKFSFLSGGALLGVTLWPKRSDTVTVRHRWASLTQNLTSYLLKC